jgi:hypothetical protein
MDEKRYYVDAERTYRCDKSLHTPQNLAIPKVRRHLMTFGIYWLQEYLICSCH